MPTWLAWLLFLPAGFVAVGVFMVLFRLFVGFAELGMYLIYRFLNYGSAEHEAVRDGHPSRAHLAGRHRPLKRWAPRCQHCFEQYEEQRRQERRQGRGEST